VAASPLNPTPARMRGMKPGRWIKRQRPELPDSVVKDWAESVKSGTTVRLTRHPAEWQGAVASCRSCQSSGNRPAVHWEAVTCASRTAALAVLIEGGSPVARCIVDPVQRVYQPIYGPRHYWLEARLVAAGFTPGEAVDGRALRRELGRIFPPDNTLPRPPRARVVAHKGREYGPHILEEIQGDIERLEQAAERNLAYASEADTGWAWTCRTEYARELREQADRARDRYRRELRKWKSVCRRLGMDGTEMGVTTVTFSPEKLPRYVPVESGAVIVDDTGFYHDPEKRFLPAIWQGPTVWMKEESA